MRVSCILRDASAAKDGFKTTDVSLAGLNRAEQTGCESKLAAIEYLMRDMAIVEFLKPKANQIAFVQMAYCHASDRINTVWLRPRYTKPISQFAGTARRLSAGCNLHPNAPIQVCAHVEAPPQFGAGRFSAQRAVSASRR